MADPKLRQRKPAYEKKNPAAHETWRERNRARNATRPKQIWDTLGWIRPQLRRNIWDTLEHRREAEEFK